MQRRKMDPPRTPRSGPLPRYSPCWSMGAFMSTPTASGPRARVTGRALTGRALTGWPDQRSQGLSQPVLPSLTGLRWLAALLVFGLHIDLAGYFGGRSAPVVSRVFASGDTGVSFFFI